jgi:hypothetical protein
MGATWSIITNPSAAGEALLVPPCLIGMEACVGTHHFSRKIKALRHNAWLMPAK